MNWKLEVVPIPVSDVDRVKHFYSEQVGFAVDLDTWISDEIRLVQLTPPGLGCSIHLNTGILDMSPGSVQGLMLVVSDIEAARAKLVERGVEVSPVQHMAAGVRRPRRDRREDCRRELASGALEIEPRSGDDTQRRRNEQ